MAYCNGAEILAELCGPFRPGATHGFAIEGLVFSFAIGGLAAAAYRTLARAPDSRFDGVASNNARHRWHGAALTSPFLVFFALLSLPWNPIYAGIGALLAGTATTLLCRPDLARCSLIGGLVVPATDSSRSRLMRPDDYMGRVFGLATYSGSCT